MIPRISGLAAAILVVYGQLVGRKKNLLVYVIGTLYGRCCIWRNVGWGVAVDFAADEIYPFVKGLGLFSHSFMQRLKVRRWVCDIRLASRASNFVQASQ
jgi:hypothetical protein